jgi:hypothetical protein
VRRVALILAAFAAILPSAKVAFAQSTSTVSLSNGVELRIRADLGPQTGQQDVKVELAPASGNSIYRIFRDQNDLAAFAYELAVERSADGEQIRLTTKPVEDEFAARFPNADGGKPVPTLSATSELEPMPSGSHVEIGLFELQGMGIKVVDAVQVRLNSGGLGETPDLNSSPVDRLRFSSLKVTINGEPASPSSASGSVSGRYTMFYIPGRGGYFFSAEAVPERKTFVKAGSIDDTRLQFTVDNDIYECVANTPILSQEGTGELWVYHDPLYQPAGNWTQEVPPPEGASTDTPGFFTAASDTLSWWLR